jgi:hypothetical protein
LEFEDEDSALILGEGVEHLEDSGGEILVFDLLGGRGDLTRERGGELGGAGFLPAADVEGAVAADGVKPFEKVRSYVAAALAAEAEESLLHDVAGVVDVAEDAGGVEGEGGLVLEHRGVDPLILWGRVVH